MGGLVLGGGLVLAWYALAPFDAARTAVVLGVGCLGAAAVVLPALRPWLPEAACQVPSRRMSEALHAAAFRWGVELGMGVRTFSVTPALYPLLAVTLVQPEPALAAVVLGLYGLARGAAIASFAVGYAHRGAEGAGIPGAGLEHAMRSPLLVAIAAATTVGLS